MGFKCAAKTDVLLPFGEFRNANRQATILPVNSLGRKSDWVARINATDNDKADMRGYSPVLWDRSVSSIPLSPLPHT